MLTYNWTDIDRDGRLWRDRDGDGVVDNDPADDEHATSTASSTSTSRRSEIDKGEYVRFMYHRAGSNALSVVRPRPVRAAHGSGRHLPRPPALGRGTHAIPVTDFEVQIDFYENVDWPWVTTPSSAAGSFDASIAVPAGTPYGMYSGAIVLTQQRRLDGRPGRGGRGRDGGSRTPTAR